MMLIMQLSEINFSAEWKGGVYVLLPWFVWEGGTRGKEEAPHHANEACCKARSGSSGRSMRPSIARFTLR